MRRKMIVSLVMILVLGMAGEVVWARSGKPSQGRQGRGGAGLMGMLSRLDLTQEQKDQVKAIQDKHKEEFRSVRQKIQEGKKALDEAINADTFNEQKIREASGALSANMETEAVLQGKIFSEIRAVLTPEQIEQMKKMREDRQSKMKSDESTGDSVMP